MFTVIRTIDMRISIKTLLLLSTGLFFLFGARKSRADAPVVEKTKKAAKEVGQAVKKGAKQIKPAAQKAGKAMKEAGVELKDAFKD